MESRTAREAGWNYSNYNLFAEEPELGKIAWLNTFSGSCSEFSREEYLQTQQILDFPEDDPLVGHYAKRGLITRKDEKEELRKIFSEACERENALLLTICPTLACNYDCPYCFEKHIPGRMTPEVMDNVVRFVQRLTEKHSFHTLSVLWFGGEPLLGLDIIESLSERLIALAEEHGMEYQAQIITNGYLLDEHAVDVLVRGRVNKVQITLDGLAESHNKTRHLTNGGGTFDVITENIRRQKIPFLVDVRFNVIRDNRSEVEPLWRFLDELAEKSGNDITYYASPAFESDAAKERNSRDVSLLQGEENSEYVYKDALKTFLSRRMGLCDALKKYALTFDHEGNVYCCGQKVGDPSELYANIRDYDPDDGDRTSVHPEINHYYQNLGDIFADCGDCVFLPRCRGECPAKRRTGAPECPEYKDHPDAYVLHIVRSLKERKKKRKSSSENNG